MYTFILIYFMIGIVSVIISEKFIKKHRMQRNARIMMILIWPIYWFFVIKRSLKL